MAIGWLPDHAGYSPRSKGRASARDRPRLRADACRATRQVVDHLGVALPRNTSSPGGAPRGVPSQGRSTGPRRRMSHRRDGQATWPAEIVVSNIFDDGPPGGLWDDEFEPAHSATPRLRAVHPLAEPPTSLSRLDRSRPDESVIDLTQRSSRRATRGGWHERRGRSWRAYALVALLGLAAAVGAVAAISGTSEEGKAPPRHALST